MFIFITNQNLNQWKNLKAKQYTNLQEKLQNPTIFSSKDYPKIAKRANELNELVALFDEQEKLNKLSKDTEELAKDPEMAQLANAELKSLIRRGLEIAAEIQKHLTPTDPNDEKDVIIEIRAAAGGDEAGLFAGDLYRMYVRYAENHGYKVEHINESVNENGGYKEVIFAVSGDGAYKN